jgi:radical SAM protein with 4Fe4S-binding SPASM domain
MISYAEKPFIAIWETTRACALACVHCRAEAMPGRDPGELTTEEGKALLDRIAAFGAPPPLVVFTGGDPLRRPDIVELVAYGTRIGLVVSLTPSGTAAVTQEKLRALRDAGLARLAVSLDAASAEAHDAFRRVRGSHRHTLRIIERAQALGLPLQINTTVCRQTVGELSAMVDQVTAFGPVLWALFFLIPVGRAQADQGLGAEEIETVLRWAAALQRRVPFGIKTTEAPQYWRVQAGGQPLTSSGSSSAGASTWPPHSPNSVSRVSLRSLQQAWPPHSPSFVSRLAPRSVQQGWPPHSPNSEAGPSSRALRAPRAVTDGNGFVFVDHVGNICPSGFLPMRAGNVREDDLAAVYREHPLFLALRDPARLGGRCGRCEWRHRCGGSRARAYAASGDPLAEDPGCAYEPAGVRTAS